MNRRSIGPPRLDLALRQRLRTLLLVNALPLLVLVLLLIQWARGHITFAVDRFDLVAMVSLLACLVVLVLSGLIALPFVAWLRRRCRWHRRGGSVLWTLPLVGAWLLWWAILLLALLLLLALWALCLLALTASPQLVESGHEGARSQTGTGPERSIAA